MKLAIQTLAGIPATLLIPLWARAHETQSSSPLIKDFDAVEILKQYDIDLSSLEQQTPLDKESTLVSVAVRTALFDQELNSFLSQYPDSVVLNLGCGLDARSYRLDNQKATWFDVDLPNIIAIRQGYFSETERHKMIATSILDSNWLPQTNVKTVLIIAEGTLIYFEPNQVEQLLVRLVNQYPTARFLFDITNQNAINLIHPTIDALGLAVPILWGIDDVSLLENCHTSLKVVRFISLYDVYPERWGVLNLLCPIFKEKVGAGLVVMDSVAPI